MGKPAKRMTFRLHQPTIEGIDALIRGGMASSRNTLIESLVDQALRGLRRRERETHAEKVYAEAFRDASYVTEQEEVVRAFAAADVETARRIDLIPSSCPARSARSRPDASSGFTAA